MAQYMEMVRTLRFATPGRFHGLTFHVYTGVIRRSLALVNDPVLRWQHALSTTVLALMVLFAVVNVSIFLELPGCPCGHASLTPIALRWPLWD